MPRFSVLNGVLTAVLLLPLVACSGKDAAYQHRVGDSSSLHYQEEGDWRDIWDSLSLRLQKDGLDAEKTQELFDRLDTPRTLAPMGAKIKELYSAEFLPRPAVKSIPTAKPKKKSVRKPASGVPGPWYKDVVTSANAQTCRAFLRQHRAAFADAQRRYGVPPEIGAALLFVETRLGRLLGRESAFYTLASMSVTRSPETIVAYLDGLPGTKRYSRWIKTRMDEKADWAYDELKALLRHCYENDLDPFAMPGSMYGAIGLCQFMPSNLERFAADGDHDGRIDIFQAPDAIASLSRYLKENGWKRGLSLRGQEKVLLRYNRSTTYARTILALAQKIRQIEQNKTRR